MAAGITPTPPPPAPPPPPPSLPPPSLPLLPAPLPAMQAASLSNHLSEPKDRPAKDRLFADKLRPALAALQGLGLTRTMRTLDSLRKHNVTTAESDELGASGRLDVQV